MTHEEFQALFNAVRSAQEGYDISHANRQKEIDALPHDANLGEGIKSVMQRLQRQAGHIADQWRRLLPACDTMIAQYGHDDSITEEDREKDHRKVRGTKEVY